MTDESERRHEAKREALNKHWDREAAQFSLKAWECPPCMAGPYQPPEAWANGSYALARERRLQLLAKDPHLYDDLPAEYREARK